MDRVFIIAEAGVNHNGSLALAFQLVDCAVEAGADCIKFQTFVTEESVCKKAKKAEYQKLATGGGESQYEMIKNLELPFEDFSKLEQYCKKKKIMFLSTPFDYLSMQFLQKLDVPFWKVPSGEITNLPFLERLGATHKNIVMSTGMSELYEIENAINVLKSSGAGDICILHCNTEYPTPVEDVNLRAMHTLKEKFQLPVGYSDHTLDIEIAIAAVAMNAQVIEKHFTLDRKMKGPDHSASLEPIELKRLVHSIRNVEAAMGNGIKTISKSEKHNIAIARKSIVAGKDIVKGTPFTAENLAVKRPGSGLSPMQWHEVIGKTAKQNFKKDDLIVL